MLSNTSKYAIRALIYLAMHSEEKKVVGINIISAEIKIPSPFLSKILQILVKNKLLVSIKGPNGGFGLAKPATKITLLNIAEIIEGKGFLDECLLGLKACTESSKTCPIPSKLFPIHDQIKDMFAKTTISEFSNVEEMDKKLVTMIS